MQHSRNEIPYATNYQKVIVFNSGGHQLLMQSLESNASVDAKVVLL